MRPDSSDTGACRTRHDKENARERERERANARGRGNGPLLSASIEKAKTESQHEARETRHHIHCIMLVSAECPCQ